MLHALLPPGTKGFSTVGIVVFPLSILFYTRVFLAPERDGPPTPRRP